MNQKSISKKVSIGIIVLIVIECLVFGTWYITQPSYKSNIISLVNSYETTDKSSFVDSLDNKTASIDSVYNAAQIYSYFNKSDLLDSTKISQFIVSNYNVSTGLFSVNNISSIQATYEAVSVLTLLNQTGSLNKTAIIGAVMSLQTNDSLFRDYSELNTSNKILVGEIDHFYEAITTLQLLYQNNTQLFSTLNLTNILTSIDSLQLGNGGILEGVLYQQSTENMQNAYYVTQVLAFFNKSAHLNESNFRVADLESWINNMYSEKGFTMQGQSEPSVEATAYAFLALKNLGWSANKIQITYPNGVSSLLNFLDSDFTLDKSRNTLDVLNDVINTINQVNLSSKLDRPYFNQQSQILFTGSIALTILAFIINSLLNLVFALKEDDSKYFEGKMHLVLEKIIPENSSDYSELSELLDENIENIEYQSIEFDSKLALLRAYTGNSQFVITYETFSYLAKKVEKYTLKNELIAVIDFLDADIFFTIDEAKEHLQGD